MSLKIYLFACLLAAVLTACVAVDGECSENEIQVECGSCDNTCDGRPEFCTLNCRNCICAEGYVRNNNVCIQPDQCPNRLSTTLGPTTESGTGPTTESGTGSTTESGTGSTTESGTVTTTQAYTAK